MQELFPVVGIWFWWIVAGVLLLLELMTPGVFAMWLALAAASVGITDYFLDLNWQLELLTFAGFSLVYVYLARPWYSKSNCRTAISPILTSASTVLWENPMSSTNPLLTARESSISKEPVGMCWGQISQKAQR